MLGYSWRESDHKRDTKREPRYGKISDTGNLKMKNMQKMMKKILLLLHDANLGFNKALFKGYSIKYEKIHK